jgi:hypothetical protein
MNPPHLELPTKRIVARKARGFPPGKAKIAAGVAKYCAEDDFAPDNTAGLKVRRLNAKAFC